MATWHSSVPDAAHPNLNAPLVAALFVPLKALATVRSYMLRSLCSVFAPLVAGWMLWRTRDPQQRNHREPAWSWVPLLGLLPDAYGADARAGHLRDDGPGCGRMGSGVPGA